MIYAVCILAALLLLSILLNPVTLVLVLRPALQCVDQRSRKPAHIAAALLGWVIDLLGTLTWWRLIGGPRQGRERTISDTLENLCMQNDHPDRELLVQIALKINRVAGYAHIKAVA